MEELVLGLWAKNMADAPSTPAAWLDSVEHTVRDAAAAGAELLVLPEHVSEQWLVWQDRSLPEREEVAAMGEAAPRMLAGLQAIVDRHRLMLLAGTAPGREAGAGWRNRARLLRPGAEPVVQDKLCLTPQERDPEAWSFEPGDRLTVITWRGLRLAILICLDIEQPALAARLQALDLDLVLVPSQTDGLDGHHRVAGCARARAIELFALVATVGLVGSIPRGPRPNAGGVAIYGPCETGLWPDGVCAELAPRIAETGPGRLLVRRLPVGEVRRMRRARAGRVWPGAWLADHVALEERAV